MASRKSGTETDADESRTLEEQMQKLNLDEKRDINILLLGETGVGKSTFINAFCNYLQFSNLQLAMRGNLTTLIPAKFTITDENLGEKVIQVGEDENEFVEVGASATQASRSYVFPIRKGKLRIRLIDTPGIGDTRGIDQDNANFENILSYIGELKHLNAICILLKPNNARLTVMFEFCIKQLLSRLEKSASRNLVFVFTNSRSTFYRPGETYTALRKLLEKVNSVDIPLMKTNIFYTDNEAFRFLALASNGIQFEQIDVDNFAQSWKKSVEECRRMVKYIAGDNEQQLPLEPHQVKNTISVNEARRLIIQLSQPLAEIAQLIQDNICILERHKRNLQLSNTTLADLKKKLYIPIVDLRVTQLDQPTTVCTSMKCATVYNVGGRSKFHYRQRCHDPCYLRNVPKEIIGAPELTSCAAMNSAGTCNKCQCRYQVHMHIYYVTETFEDRIEDDAIKSEISSKEFAVMTANNIVMKIERRVCEYGQERELITKTTAKFACFLKANAITPYNDSYQRYLEYLIDREQSMGDVADDDLIRQFRRMLREYNEEKDTINRAMLQSGCAVGSISAEDVIKCIESLYSLKHSGPKIQELFMKQKAARKDENRHETREYVHNKTQKKLRKPRKKNKNRRQKDLDTTDSEYFTDSGPRNTGGQHFNRHNFRPNRYQRGGRGQGYRNQYNQEYDAATNQQNPMHYLHIKQSPYGHVDVCLGQANKPNKQYQLPKPLMDMHNRNYGASSTSVPYDNPPPPPYSRRPNFRSHSPGPLYPHNQQGSNPFHQGRRGFGHGPNPNCGPSPPNNYGPTPPNYGPTPPNYRPTPPNYGRTPNYGPARPDYRSTPPNYGSNSNYRPNPNYGANPNFGGTPNRGANANQGSKPFNQGPKRNQGPKYFGQHPKDDPLPPLKHNKQQSGRNTPNRSDSGCESSSRQMFTSHGSARTHCLDLLSSSSSSDSSSEDEQYMSCSNRL